MQTEQYQGFEGNLVLIRKLRISDSLNIYLNIRDREVSKWTGPPEHRLLDNQLGRLICRLARHIRKGLKLFWNTFFKSQAQKIFRFAIVLKKTNKAIGIISLTKNQPHDDFADLGFWIGKKYWGQGLTTEAVRLVLKACFNELRLNRIESWTFEKNVPSWKVLEKCGLHRKASIQNAYVKYNETQNRLNYEISRNDFDKINR